MELAKTALESAEKPSVAEPFTNGTANISLKVSGNGAQIARPDDILSAARQYESTNDLSHADTKRGFLPSPGEEDDYESYDVSQNEAASSAAATEEHRIQAFAKLEFADGDFYMTTYAMELGRDRQNASPSQGIYWRASEEGSKNQSTSSAAGSVKVENDGENSVRESIEDHGGNNEASVRGAVHNGAVGQDEFMSTTSSSQHLSRRGSTRNSRKDYNALAMLPVRDSTSAVHIPNIDDFDLSAPLDCPLVPIQQPQKDRGRPVNKKSISRRHARIAFNFEKHYFELLFLGRNGGFLDEEWFAPGDIQPLVNGSVIQIGGLGVRFILPDVPPGETGADEIENGDHESIEADSVEDAEDSNEEELQDQETGKMTTRGRGKINPQVEADKARNKRKGPGRPPKNGVMSKREQAQMARESREKIKDPAQRKAEGISGRGKGKTAKALELEQSSLQASGRRKYTKRKRAGGLDGDQNIRESTEMTDSAPPEQATPVKPPKEKRPPKPPRSPSPQWDESTLTPEQLAKPQASYVILIHEALTNSKTGAMSLPQIYRAIERKYPYFKLKVTTQGWQSSVRHNLGQHAAFRKIERDGKGWMWGYDAEVSIEKEKKRRATPPPSTNPQPRYYPQPPTNHPRPNQYPYPGVPFPPGQLPTNGLHPMAYGHHPGMSASPLPPRPPFGAPGFPMILNAKSESTYQSPYNPDSSGQPSPHTSQPQSNSYPNGTTSNGNLPTQPPPSIQPHYPNYQPPTTNPLSIPNGVSYKPPPPSQSHNSSNQKLSHHALTAVFKFKSALMDEMDSKPHAERLIQSAIDRTLGLSSESKLTSKEDLENEKGVMTALDHLLQDIGESDNGGKQWAEGERDARANEFAKDVVKKLPTVATAATTAAAAAATVSDSQPDSSETPHSGAQVGTNGSTTLLKHARQSSAEDDAAGPPPGKKLSRS